MPKPNHNDKLPSIDRAALEAVTGGAGDASMMMPMMMMMQSRRSAAAPPPPPAAPQLPKIMLNGVEQPASALTSTPAGKSFEATV